MQWTSDQKKIIEAKNCNLLVSAAAGSGKTAVLVERIIQMVTDAENPIDINELLVVTFTKAAASQMKDKIRRAMETIIEKHPENQHIQKQLHLLNQANILTIDSFCYKVVKEHFYDIGMDPNIRIGEMGELALLRDEVMKSVIEKYYKENPGFAEFSEAFCGDKSDESLEVYIKTVYDVSSSFPRPELWIEQAKKDLCITSEQEFMSLSYVMHYFNELKNTACRIKDQILEALNIARGIDGPFYMEKALLSDVTLLDDIINSKTYTNYHELTKEKFTNIGRGKDGTYDKELAEKVKNIRNHYKDDVKNLLKVFQVPIDQVLEQMKEQSKMLIALLDATEEFRSEFLAQKLEKNILEFSDVEHFALQILCKGYDKDGQPVPSRIGSELSEEFYEIMIDEYQDSNYLQEAILRCVSKVPYHHNNIFMVGDVKQSIYSFRMARPDLFMEKYHTYKGDESADNRKLLLKNNFRSRKNVLEGINYIFYQIMGADLGGIDYTGEEALVPSRQFEGYEEDCVELLMGESKNFDIQMAESGSSQGALYVAQKDETLDENLEDIGKKELEATMIANRIDSLFGKNGENVYQVTDDDTGKMRDVSYRDIVILLRAPSGFGDVFSEILMNRGIPVRIQNETGYLDTVEIHQILSLLRAVDNPYNEVELVASLRGFFGKFTEEDLTKMILKKRELEAVREVKLHIYDFMGEMVSRSGLDADFFKQWSLQDKALYEKCRAYTDLFDEITEKIQYMSISQVIQWLFYQKDYYYYVQALPQGAERIRNLDLFMDEVLHFEQSNCQGLFDFLRYIDEIIEKKISLGGDPSMDCDEDVVRIMSIHKSKGLEFPVVFVAGMGKQFNLRDTKERLIVHSDYYLGAKYVNTKKRCGNDSFSRQVFASLMKTESIAEELRIFYVALTRAKEKLIMTGVVPDIPKLIHRYDSIAGVTEEKLGFAYVRSANSYMDLVVAAMIRNRVFHDAMEQVRPRYDEKNETFITADYECNTFFQKTEFDFKVRINDYYQIAVQHVLGQKEDDDFRKNQIRIWKKGDNVRKAEYEKALSYKYPNLKMTMQKSKLSVTEIKRMYELSDDVEVIRWNRPLEQKQRIPIPEFMKGKNDLPAALKGTYIHKIMELLDFKGVQSKDDIIGFYEENISKRFPEIKAEEILPIVKIQHFLSSDLGMRMKAADEKGKLHKEQRFVVGVPVEKIYPTDEPVTQKDTVVVQGIVDVYFEEGDAFVLVDYKTDRLMPGEEDMLVKRYYTQMQYYKDTLEQLTGKTVKETYLYSFSLDKEIRIL